LRVRNKEDFHQIIIEVYVYGLIILIVFLVEGENENARLERAGLREDQSHDLHCEAYGVSVAGDTVD
jgi:hypothetical protein